MNFKLLLPLAVLAAAAAPAAWGAGECGSETQKTDLMAYSGAPGSYLCNVEEYCKGQSRPITLRGDAKPARNKWDASGNARLVSFTDPRDYSEIKNAADLWFLEPSLGFQPKGTVEDSPLLRYRAKMNRTFNCAILLTKRSVYQRLKSTFEKDGDQPFADALAKSDAKLDSGFETNGCVAKTVGNQRNLSVPLTDQAAYETCVYRYYLLYLGTKVGRDAGIVTAAFTTNPVFGNPVSVDASAAAGLQARLAAKVSDEDLHARRTYRAALAAYAEFARTFGPHILLQAVERDYTRIRDAFNVLMNPISQVLYKAVNAMDAKGTK